MGLALFLLIDGCRVALEPAELVICLVDTDITRERGVYSLDLSIHLLRNASVGKMPLLGRTELDEVKEFA